MAIDFPASPSLNDTFSSGGVTYTWDGTVWAASGSAAFLVAADGIDGLGDVDTSTVAPTDGQALVWDNTASQWEPGSVASEGANASAWARTGGSGSLQDGLNISCSKGGTGVYNYTFTSPMPSANYAVVCNPSSSARVAGLSNIATTGFTLTTATSSGTAADAAHHLVVHATNATLPETVTTENILFTDGRNASTGIQAFDAGIRLNGNTTDTLDDYEEGTWTPTVAGTTTAGTASYTQQHGSYEKIGRQVTARGYISWNSATGTGVLEIRGLPFASSSTSFDYLQTGSVMVNNITIPTGYTMGTLYLVNGVSAMNIYWSGSNQTWLLEAPEASGSLIFSITYSTDT